jgi:hypothetical protein
MPFGKRLKDLAWRPEHIEAMRSAFEKVCEVRKLKCGPGDPRTDFIVIKIIELAKAGEADPDRLCSQALLDFMPVRLSENGALNRRCVAMSCSRFCLGSI